MFPVESWRPNMIKWISDDQLAGLHNKMTKVLVFVLLLRLVQAFIDVRKGNFDIFFVFPEFPPPKSEICVRIAPERALWSKFRTFQHPKFPDENKDWKNCELFNTSTGTYQNFEFWLIQNFWDLENFRVFSYVPLYWDIISSSDS